MRAASFGAPWERGEPAVLDGEPDHGLQRTYGAEVASHNIGRIDPAHFAMKIHDHPGNSFAVDVRLGVAKFVVHSVSPFGRVGRFTTTAGRLMNGMSLIGVASAMEEVGAGLTVIRGDDVGVGQRPNHVG